MANLAQVDNFALVTLHLVAQRGVGAATIKSIYQEWGTPQHFVRQYKPGKSRRLDLAYEALSRAVDSSLERRLASWRHQAQVVSIFESGYPSRLRHLYDPPPLLFLRGQALDWQDQVVCVVGTRTPDLYGREVTQRLCRDLVDMGVAVGSGMAAGIDAEAHRAVLSSGGTTFAVLGTGPDDVYPSQHANLKREIEDNGMLLTEFSPGSPREPRHFAQRNRLLAALADLVIVVQGGIRSGSLITAKCALELGKEVMAVPGEITNPLSQAPLGLIRDGATPYLGPESLSGVIAKRATKDALDNTPQRYVTLSADQGDIVAAMAEGESYDVDLLVSATGREPSHIYMMLLELELGGVIAAHSDGTYTRAKDIRITP